MRILITGACGFVGSTLIRTWLEGGSHHQFVAVDSLVRPGSETNRETLRRFGVDLRHADLRLASDFEGLPTVDVVVDAAANPSVLAGVDGTTSSRQIVEHNLIGTINMLEFCRRHGAVFILLSTSRVYSIPPLARLPLRVVDRAFEPDCTSPVLPGFCADGISEGFSTAAPVSLYGATKLASETLALEYGQAFSFPVWIDRCGVLAGAGQFGRPDQGVFAFWVNSWLRKRELRYNGFGGKGYQVRDCLHPADLVPLLDWQMKSASGAGPAIANVSGGRASAMSLRQLSDWCRDRFGPHVVEAAPESRPFDLPWVVLDATLARGVWGWNPARTTVQILEEIARHAETNSGWLELSASS